MAIQPACCLAPQPMTRIFERPFAPSATPMLSCTTHAVVGCRSHAPTHLFASSSAHACLIFSLFSLAASRFSLVRSRRSPRRHMLTLYFASLQLPVTFHRKPRAWHSSRAATTSAQLFCTCSVWRWGCIWRRRGLDQVRAAKGRAVAFGSYM